MESKESQTPQLSPLDEPETNPVVEPTPPKEKKKMMGVMYVVFVVLLIGLGALSYYFYSQSQSHSDQLNKANTDLSAATTTIANLRTALGKANETSTEPIIKEGDEKQVILDMTTAAFKAIVANASYTPVTGIVKQDTDFARSFAGRPNTDGATTYIFKKVNDLWILIYSGDGDPTQDIVTKYGIPADIAKES